MNERVRVVVGEGHGSPRPGLLRFVLEGEGHEVLAEAGSPGELARALAAHQPDVVVLDDGIGVGAVQLTRDVCPDAKVLLIWPEAVMPVGGDARIEPGEILTGLGAAVGRLAATIVPLRGIEKPEWIDRVRKDPSTLRERLAKQGGVPNQRPSVTELQKRGRRLRPVPAQEEEREELVAPLVVLPAAATARASAAAELADEAMIVLPGASAPGGSRDAVTGPRAGRNRRIGIVALGGAVAASAMTLALAVGVRHIPTTLLRSATAFIPAPIGPGNAIVWTPPGSGGDGGPGVGPTTPPTGPTAPGGTDTGSPTTGGDQGPSGDGGGGPGGGGGGPGGGGGGPGDGGGGPGDGGGGPGGGGGGPGGGGPGIIGCAEESGAYASFDADTTCDDGLPGMSELHNPNGGPPGLTHEAPRYSQGAPTPGAGQGHAALAHEANAERKAARHPHKR